MDEKQQRISNKKEADGKGGGKQTRVIGGHVAKPSGASSRFILASHLLLVSEKEDVPGVWILQPLRGGRSTTLLLDYLVGGFDMLPGNSQVCRASP